MVKSWLEDVPAEIRCMTYKHFFQSVKVEIHGDHKLVKRRKMSRRTATAILLTCKTVNKEADPYFFQEAEFVIKECHCWKKDPETRPRRLKEICYLTFATVPSEDYWVSLWWDLIWSKQEAQPTTSGIKVLKIAAACSAEDIGTCVLSASDAQLTYAKKRISHGSLTALKDALSMSKL